MGKFISKILKNAAIGLLILIAGVVVLLAAVSSAPPKEQVLPTPAKASEAWKADELAAVQASREPAAIVTDTPKTDKMPVVRLTPKASEVITIRGQIVDNDQYKVIRATIPIQIGVTSPQSFAAELQSVLKQHPKKLIIDIDSPGGNVLAGNQILSLIESSGLPVVTVCTGTCASMGLTIFMSGDNRYVTNHGILMAHPMAGGTNGDIYQVRSQSRLMDRLAYRLDQYVASRAGLTLPQYLELARGEYYADNEQAFAVGFSHGTAKWLVENDFIPVITPGSAYPDLGLSNKSGDGDETQPDVSKFMENLEKQIPASLRALKSLRW